MTQHEEITDGNLDKYLSGGAYDPPHPGQILDSIIRQRGVSVPEAALQMAFSESVLNKILRGEAKISDDNASAIAKYAKNPEVFWTRAQKIHDLWSARQSGNPSPA